MERQREKRVQRRTQIERKEDAEEKLIASAIRLIARKGVSSVTLGEIGVEAGYSRGLPTHHFGSKTALIREVGKRIKEINVSEIEQQVGKFQGLEGIKRSVARYFERDSAGKEGSGAIMALLCDALTEDSETVDVMTDYIGFWIQHLQNFFEDAVRMGQVSPDLDVHTQSALLLGTLRGTLLQHMISPDYIDLKAASKALQANIEALRLSSSSKR